MVTNINSILKDDLSYKINPFQVETAYVSFMQINGLCQLLLYL